MLLNIGIIIVSPLNPLFPFFLHHRCLQILHTTITFYSLNASFSNASIIYSYVYLFITGRAEGGGGGGGGGGGL